MKIAPNVYLIRDMFVNLYMIAEPDGLTLIDAGMGRAGRKVLSTIAEINRAPQDLKRILITHCDADHVGGVTALKTKTGARVYANHIEAEAMAAGRSSRDMKASGLAGILFGLARILFKFTPVAADVDLASGDVLPVLGGLHVLATPGHTPGHTSFYAPLPGILFSGDSIISRGNALRVSMGSNTWDEVKARESATAQAALGARIMCTGHGPVVFDAAGKMSV